MSTSTPTNPIDGSNHISRSFDPPAPPKPEVPTLNLSNYAAFVLAREQIAAAKTANMTLVDLGNDALGILFEERYTILSNAIAENKLYVLAVIRGVRPSRELEGSRRVRYVVV
jgi:hypothetical protein